MVTIPLNKKKILVIYSKVSEKYTFGTILPSSDIICVSSSYDIQYIQFLEIIE